MTRSSNPVLESTSSAFERLPAPLRERIEGMATPRSFERGAVILREGDDTPFLGVVETGRVALRLRVPELGDRLTIVTIEPGELLGWSAVVAPFRATVDAVATEPVRLVTFAAQPLRAQLFGDCELAGALLPIVLESLSHRLNASWQQLLDLFGNRSPEPW